jgi:hypothetical protein
MRHESIRAIRSSLAVVSLKRIYYACDLIRSQFPYWLRAKFFYEPYDPWHRLVGNGHRFRRTARDISPMSTGLIGLTSKKNIIHLEISCYSSYDVCIRAFFILLALVSTAVN